MKQTNIDIGVLIEDVLNQNHPSVSFDSVWGAYLKNNRKVISRRPSAIPWLAVMTLMLLSIVGFTGYTIGRNIDKTDYPFVNDPSVIGKWESVDFVEKISDFVPGEKSCQENLYLSTLVFVKNGKMLGSFENGNLANIATNWTKGRVLNKQEKTASKYEIKEINGSTYMFFEWKSGDYIFRNLDPQYYVLKKVDSQDYSHFQVTRVKEDKVDYPFIDDAQMRGKWESVDFVQTIDSFKPGEKSSLVDLYLKGLTLDKNGISTAATTSGAFANPSITWTKGLIIDRNNKTASKCEIKIINGATYMFFEWKSGDYVYRGMNPNYYVLKKVE